MIFKRIFIAALPVALSIPSAAAADIAATMSRYEGYTISAVKTIDKWISSDRSKSGDAFEGCDFGRYIVFDDGTYLRCNDYGYDYDYRPEAVILTRGNRVVMIVGDDAYDMTFQ